MINDSDIKDSKDIVYEVRKKLEVKNIMQLIDLNGTKKNFQSEFVLQTDPSKKVSICVVNQEDLDNGNINFEETERGKYSKLITFRNNKHVNHYIAIKKHPQEESDNVECDLVINMKELPPPPKLVDKEMPEEDKEKIRQQLFELRNNDQYKNMPITNELNIKDVIDNNNTNNNYGDSNIIQNNMLNNPTSNIKKEPFINPYFIIGLICLLCFGYLFYKKKIKKN